MVRPAALLVCLVALPAWAAPGAFVRFAGGGRARIDCMLVADVAGVAPGRVARCTDGDPACDSDGAVNGICSFEVRLCLDAVTMPACGPDVVEDAALVSSDPALGSLAAALGAVTKPVMTQDTCTATVTVPAATRGRRSGRVVLRATATMASRHVDRDRLPLVCRPHVGAAPATFADIQRTVFAVSCTTPSCHGAGAAGGLSLLPADAYGNLVGTTPTNPAAAAAGLLRVTPGDPERSFLLAKLLGTLGPGEGGQMPQVGGPLPAAKLDLVRRWITAGAPADASF